MTTEDISKFLQKKSIENAEVQISFRARNSFKGIFIKMQDYDELRSKNLWRIVSEGNIAAYKQSNDDQLAKIFNGVEFTKLQLLQ